MRCLGVSNPGRVALQDVVVDITVQIRPGNKVVVAVGEVVDGQARAIYGAAHGYWVLSQFVTKDIDSFGLVRPGTAQMGGSGKPVVRGLARAVEKRDVRVVNLERECDAVRP